MIGSEAANYDDCPPHRHTSYGPGLAFCETHQQLLVDVERILAVAGLEDRDGAEWEDLALISYQTADAVRTLPIPCVVIVLRGDEQRAYQVDVRFSTKGENHGEG